MSDWRGVTEEEVAAREGGREVLSMYPSLGSALESAYPGFTWKTDKLPNGYWQNDRHLLQALSEAEKKLGIKQVVLLKILDLCIID